jgi:ABC-type Mn2+/Zn2+ transport system ATPase subunit
MCEPFGHKSSLISFYVSFGVTLGLVDPLASYYLGSLGNDLKSQTLFILMDSHSSSMVETHLDEFGLMIASSFVVGSPSAVMSSLTYISSLYVLYKDKLRTH